MKKIILILLFVNVIAFLFPSDSKAEENLLKTPFADINVSSEKFYNAFDSPLIVLTSRSSFFQKVYGIVSQDNPKITIIDPQGISVKEEAISGNSQQLNLADQNPLPGKYTVNVNSQKAIEFYWGVLAINTNKSVYHPNETAYLQMASLDKYGHTLCNSNLKLSIRFPDGTTFNPSIEKSNECFGDTIAGDPDYYTYQDLAGIGTYIMQLTNLDNGFSVTDSFEVKENIAFDIERIGPTRINPIYPYSMKIVITANKDFKGIVEEKISEGFQIFGDTKWEVDLKNGETTEYVYQFDAPDVSPELFLINPLSIGKYKEARFWQIASDAIAFTNQGTSANPDINDGSNCTDPCSYANTSWTPPTSGLIVVFVHNRGSNEAQGVVPTVSGNNITWTQIATVAHGTTADVYTLFGADATSSSDGVTTFSYGSNLQLNMTASFFSVTGIDLTGGVAAAFVQSPTTSGTNTSGSITLNAAGNSNNRPISGWGHMAQEGSNFRGPTGDGQGSTDWTEVDDMSGAGPARGIETQYRSDAFETTASSSWTTSSAYLGIAAEIKAAASGITVSGIVYLANESTTATTGNGGQCDGSTANLSLRVNTGAATTTTCSSSDGTFSFTGIAASSGDTITIYSTASDKSNRVYVSDGTADTGQNLYKNAVAVGDEADGTVTILDLLDYDSTTNDTDMLYDAVDTTTDTLTTESNIQLHIHTGDTLDPGGTVTTSGTGNLHLDDSSVAYLDTATNTIGGDVVIDDSSNIHFDTNTTISGGDITVASGGDVTSAAGTVTMGASGTIGGGSTGSVFQLTNLTISSGTTILGADADNILVFDGDITISAGAILAMNSKTADVNGGNVITTTTGSITCASCSAGGLTISGDGSSNGLGGGSGAITLYSLTLDGAINTTAVGTTAITVLDDITIGANRTLSSASSGTINIADDWSNSGTFTANSGIVAFNGPDSSNQALTGNVTFYNFTASTSSNSAGRTIQFAGSSTTTVTGTWTITGFSGKVITLQSSDTNAWTINPTAASVTYVSVSRSTNTGTSFCATNSTNGVNNTSWNISAGANCTAPNTPTLDSPTNGATEQSITPTLLTTATDSDSDYLRYKIELCTNSIMTLNCQTFDQTSSQTGWSGQNTQTSTAYTSGTQATYTIQTSLSVSTTYYWRTYAIDPGGSNTWSGTQTPNSFTTATISTLGNSKFKGLNFKGINIQ